MVTKVDVTGLPVAPIAPYKFQFDMYALQCNSRASRTSRQATCYAAAAPTAVHCYGHARLRPSRNPDTVTSCPRRPADAELRGRPALA